MAPSELYSTILVSFREAGWAYSEVDGKEVIRAGFEAHHTRVELHVQAFQNIAAVSVVAESARGASEPARRERLAELAMRVNQTLTIGNFELDWDSGKLFFRATNIFPTPQGDTQIIQGLVHNTVGEMDRICPLETMIFQADGAALASLDLVSLLRRDDLLPGRPLESRSIMPDSFPDYEKICVLKNGTKLGPFNVDEILERIETGEFTYDDICLRKGSLECERLREVLDWEEEPDSQEEYPEGEEADEEDEGSPEPEAPQPRSTTLLYRGHPSILMRPGALVAIAAGAIGGTWLYSHDYWYTVAGWAIAILGITNLSYVRFTCDYFITNRRIEVIRGLVARSSSEVRIKDIRSINVTCRGLAGIFGIGTVDFFTSGDEPEISFVNIWRAKKVKAFVRRLQDREQSPA